MKKYLGSKFVIKSNNMYGIIMGQDNENDLFYVHLHFEDGSRFMNIWIDQDDIFDNIQEFKYVWEKLQIEE